MPDYAGCLARNCPDRGRCARYLMVSDSTRQTYFSMPGKDDGSCDYGPWDPEDAPFRTQAVGAVDARIDGWKEAR